MHQYSIIFFYTKKQRKKNTMDTVYHIHSSQNLGYCIFKGYFPSLPWPVSQSYPGNITLRQMFLLDNVKICPSAQLTRIVVKRKLSFLTSTWSRCNLLDIDRCLRASGVTVV